MKHDAKHDVKGARIDELHSFRLPITAADEVALLLGTLDELRAPVLQAARMWRRNAAAKPWLVLCSPVGRGKTLAIADTLLMLRGRYIGARELERMSMSKFGDEAEMFAQLQNTGGVLCIDDVGREDDVGRMQSALLDLVDYRRGRNARTILATNFTRQTFVARYADARLQSRLAECAQWFADVGPDLRSST